MSDPTSAPTSGPLFPNAPTLPGQMPPPPISDWYEPSSGDNPPTVIEGIDKRDMALLACVLYDPRMYEQYTHTEAGEELTLGQWADNFDMDTYRDIARSLQSEKDAQAGLPPRGPGGMTDYDMEQVLKAVKNDPVLANATILNVTLRDAGGNMAAIAVGGSLIVAYQGTAGPPEWMDDGQGGMVAVTDTPDQMEALRYFNQIMATYGSQYDLVVTTGHSKGGNLAAYVAMLSGGTVDQVISIDGQGFNAASQLKYHDEIDDLAQQGTIATYAGTWDFVNILFGSVSSTTGYTDGPDLSWIPFEDYHSPYSMFYVGLDGNLYLRDDVEQSPVMTAAHDLVMYLMKYMSADDFVQLCDLAMGLVNHSLSIDKDVVPGGIDILGLIDLYIDGDWDKMEEPYRSILRRLIPLIQAFYQGGGLDPDKEKAIVALFEGLGLVDPGLVTSAEESAIIEFLSRPSDVPYWPEVRDFSDAVKEQLLALVEKVTPHGFWEHIADFFGDGNLQNAKDNGLITLDFSMDDQARQTYYQETMDLGNMTSEQIEKIFDDVIQVDQKWSTSAAEWKSSADSIQTQLASLEESLQA